MRLERSPCTPVKSQMVMDPAACKMWSRTLFCCGVNTSWDVISHSVTSVLNCMPQLDVEHGMPSAAAALLLRMPT